MAPNVPLIINVYIFNGAFLGLVWIFGPFGACIWENEKE
jgi:hypothetical protein